MATTSGSTLDAVLSAGGEQTPAVAILRGKLDLLVTAATQLLAPPVPVSQDDAEAARQPATAPATDAPADADGEGKPAEAEASPSLPLTQSVLVNLPMLFDPTQGLHVDDADLVAFLQTTLFKRTA